MTLNPVIEESINLHFTTHQFKVLHGIYIGSMVLVTVALWPSRGFMEFFSTQTVPAAFEAIVVFQLITLSGISVYVGLDRAFQGRTDGSLVRFTVPIVGDDEDAAEMAFQDLAPRILALLPDYVPE